MTANTMDRHFTPGGATPARGDGSAKRKCRVCDRFTSGATPKVACLVVSRPARFCAAVSSRIGESGCERFSLKRSTILAAIVPIAINVMR